MKRKYKFRFINKLFKSSHIMTRKILNVVLIAILLTSNLAIKLPTLKGPVRMTELVERQVISALKKYDNELSR